MTPTILHHLDQRIRDALDGARAAGAALARSAHEIVEVAQPEPTPTAVGTSGRADLLHREMTRSILTGVSLGRIEGQLAAYGAVLRMLDDARLEEHAAAVARIDQEGESDGRNFVRDREHDPELERENVPEYAAASFDAWYAEEDDSVIGPLDVAAARAAYVAAFVRTVSK